MNLCISLYIFCSIYSFLGIVYSFLKILLFSLLIGQESDRSIYLYWIKIVAPHSNLFILLSTPSCKILSNYSLKMASCALGTGCGFSLYALASVCSSLCTGFIFQLPSVLSKINSYLPNILWSIACSTSVKCFIYDVNLCIFIFHCEHIRCDECVVWRPSHFRSPVFLHSEIFRY